MFGWPIVKVGLKSRTHYRPFTAGQRRELAKCPRALIVDAAIRTGKTLQSLVGLLRTGPRPPANEVVAFYDHEIRWSPYLAAPLRHGNRPIDKLVVGNDLGYESDLQRLIRR